MGYLVSPFSENCLWFNFGSVLQLIKFMFVDLFSKSECVDAKFVIFQNFRNFWISNFYFRWLYIIEKMSNLMVDPALNSLDSKLFNALFDDITAFFPAGLSRNEILKTNEPALGL